ncbi:MAG: hypothetical protein AB9835_11695 [Eubacteriales bacterium]
MNVGQVVRGAQLSALAYNDIQPQVGGTAPVLIGNVEYNVQCWLRRKGDTLSVTFRGSDSDKDWQTNLTFWKKTIPYGNVSSPIRVHTGFLNAYKSPGVRDRLHASITPETRRIFISGHSQGAALAVLCAVDMEYNFPDRDIEAVLFGCPRVGNKAFASSYDKRVFKTLNVQNGNDIVTKLPPAIYGYRHVGIKLHVGVPRVFGALSCGEHRLQSYYSHIFREFIPQ